MLTTEYPIVNACIKQGQTVLDFTAQNAGDLEALFDVALSNGVGITEVVMPGTRLRVPQLAPKVIRFFYLSIYDIITGGNPPIKGGIGYMQIGTTFKIS